MPADTASGTYWLQSHHAFNIRVNDNVPKRDDFGDSQPFCAEGHGAFLYKDPKTNKYSTYIVLSDTIMLEMSNNGGGKAHVWRKSG